jgi:glutathione S-transferase
MKFTLISHPLCPYVQRAAILLAEKGVPFERREVDLAHKPDWFLAVSPLGKTPVLLVDDTPLFESAVICEYLDETQAPPLHPADPLARAQHRAWMEFGSAVLNDIARYYSAADDAALDAAGAALQGRFTQLEQRLRRSNGPYFAGERLSLVDAVFGPVFRYFDVLERVADARFFDAAPRVSAWRGVLSQRASVRAAVAHDYPQRLEAFLRERRGALSQRMARIGSAAFEAAEVTIR